ncbi:hypothetical protein [Streptomyces sp. NPDC050535]|uniref:hypothetical protein n=1 Tax=Streptomyces sp. NPDC050535 TaxID=3365626 RepID=UPI0037914E65
MRTHQGGAAVIVGEADHEVEADLWSHTEHLRVRAMGDVSSMKGQTSWGGTLYTDDEAAAWAILNGGVMQLRVWGAGEGEFLASHGTVGGGSIEITGNGDPPF